MSAADDASFVTSGCQLWGHIIALDFVVKVLLVTHPDRPALAKAWRELLPDHTDYSVTDTLFEIPALSEEHARVLAEFTRLIETEPGDDDTD
jgi:hypothetical protein